MQIGMIGLGRMGSNMVLRLVRGGHKCVVFDRNPQAVTNLVNLGEGNVQGADSLTDLIKKLPSSKTLWMMLPAGEITNNTIEEAAKYLQKGDTIVDGGNTYFKDDIIRAEKLAKHGINYMDVGTSGGVWGLDRGYCLMLGGTPEVYKAHETVFATLAPGSSDIAPSPNRTNKHNKSAELGYLYCGPAGAGHFVKMVHNGIEYGLMQAYAEGFDIMLHAQDECLPANARYNLPLEDIAELWRRGSVVTSWLLDLTADALAKNPKLSEYSGVVNDSGEGRWTVQAAIDEAVPAEVLTAALYTRFRSRQEHTFAEKVLSAMRMGFGGHVETPK